MSGNLSLERGLSVLEQLSHADEALGVREMARRLELSAPAVQRIVNTLADQGFVEQEQQSRRYRLGRSVLALARHILNKDRLVGIAEPELQALAAEGSFNAFLGARRGDQGIYLLTVQSSGPVVIRSAPGESFRLHSTALGKALLFGLGGTAIAGILGKGSLERVTPATIADPEELVAQVKAADDLGYATSVDENFFGLIAVGAPLRDASGAVVAGISVAYPRSVGPAVSIDQAARAVTTAANRISKALGYRKESGGDVLEVSI